MLSDVKLQYLTWPTVQKRNLCQLVYFASHGIIKIRTVATHVCLLATSKTDEPIEVGLPFAVCTRVRQRNHTLEGARIPFRERGKFGEGLPAYCKVYRICVVSRVKNGRADPDASCLQTRVGPRNHVWGAHWHHLAKTTDDLCAVTMQSCVR